MTGKHFFEIYNFQYHDGNISDVCFEDGDMILSVTRCPLELKSKEDANSLFQRLRFKNVSNFWLWNEEKNYTSGVSWEDMWIPSSIRDVGEAFRNDAAYWIDDAFFDSGMVVYDYQMRFKCEDIEIVESRTNPEYFGTTSKDS